jgi:hypothetical protein
MALAELLVLYRRSFGDHWLNRYCNWRYHRSIINEDWDSSNRSSWIVLARNINRGNSSMERSGGKRREYI